MPPTQTIINQDVAPQERPHLTADEVRAQWLQNAGGGLGVACIVGLVAVVAVWGAGADWQTAVIAVAVSSVGAGLFAFGVLMAVRSVIDEVMDIHAWRNMVADLAAYEADLQAAEETIAARNTRIKELERELAGAQEAARGKNFTTAEPESTSPLGEDVRELVRIRYAIGEHPSRRYMADTYQWSQPRHERAVSELRRAGVLVGERNNPTWPDTMIEAIDKLAGVG